MKDNSPKLIIDLGMRYATDTSKQKTRFGLYKCGYCGREFEVNSYSIKYSKVTPSCGCQEHRPREKSIKHGLHSNRFYSTWNAMIHRCTNKQYKNYQDYGARGITVCDEWLDVTNFVAWAEATHPNIEGYSLDRINIYENYSPNNCRWATKITQSRNTRDIQSNNTSGYRGVGWHKASNTWRVRILLNYINTELGSYPTALEGAKAYETYVRLNKLEHNFTPALTEEEVEALYKQEETK